MTDSDAQELIAGLRTRARDLRRLATTRSQSAVDAARVHGKASAYEHAADLLEAATSKKE